MNSCCPHFFLAFALYTHFLFTVALRWLPPSNLCRTQKQMPQEYETCPRHAAPPNLEEAMFHFCGCTDNCLSCYQWNAFALLISVKPLRKTKKLLMEDQLLWMWSTLLLQPTWSDNESCVSGIINLLLCNWTCWSNPGGMDWADKEKGPGSLERVA